MFLTLVFGIGSLFLLFSAQSTPILEAALSMLPAQQLGKPYEKGETKEDGQLSSFLFSLKVLHIQSSSGVSVDVNRPQCIKGMKSESHAALSTSLEGGGELEMLTARW